MESWHALYTKPRCEQQVDEILSEKGIETYVPLIRVRQRGKTVERPFFPRYMFVRCDFDEIGLSEVKWTPGLTGIISFGGGGPTKVPDAIIERLKTRLQEINSEGTYSPFEKGEKVRIKSGPFRDFDAVFEEHLSTADRVQILIEVLGGPRRTEVDVSQIEQVG